MNFITFQPETYRDDFSDAIKDLLPSLKSGNDDVSKTALEMVVAVERSIDVMTRVNAEYEISKQSALSKDDINKIGDYILTLLDELSIVAANRGLQQTMLSLHRLTLPVAVWIADHNGKIDKLDIVVNAIAGYANELTDNKQMADFCETVGKVVNSVSDEIKMDMEATNPMRPWRILNLNWGIVATRSHNTDLMAVVFDQLIKNIPADVRQFFKEGMQQMEIVNYPDHVKTAMEKYYKLYQSDDNFH